jgi:hypothetical protein
MVRKVRILEGLSVPGLNEKPETAKCPYIPQKKLLSVPIVRSLCKIYQKTYENYNKLEELHEKYFKILPAAQILLIQMKNMILDFVLILSCSS